MKLTDVSQMSDGISEIKEIIENGFCEDKSKAESSDDCI